MIPAPLAVAVLRANTGPAFTPAGHLQTDLALIVLIGAAVSALAYLSKHLVRGARKSFAVADVILGNPDNDQPGLHERLQRLEQQGARVEQRLEWAEHELSPNSGLSLRDAVDRLEQNLHVLSNEFTQASTASQERRAEDRAQAEKDREALHRLATRVDQLKQHMES